MGMMEKYLSLLLLSCISQISGEIEQIPNNVSVADNSGNLMIEEGSKPFIEPLTILQGAAAVFTIVKTIFDMGNFDLGLPKSQEVKALEELKDKLEKLDEKVTELKKEMLRIEVKQEWQHAYNQFGVYVRNLDYLREEFKLLKLNDKTGELQYSGSAKIAKGNSTLVDDFRDKVLDKTSGADRALFEVHKNIMGTQVFEQKSILKVYTDYVPVTQQSKKYFLSIFVSRLLGLQAEGYAHYFTALNLNGQRKVVPRKLGQMRDRLIEQAKSINKHVNGALGDFYKISSDSFQAGCLIVKIKDRCALPCPPKTHSCTCLRWEPVYGRSCSQKPIIDTGSVPQNTKTAQPLESCKFVKKTAGTVSLQCTAMKLNSLNHPRPNVQNTYTIKAQESSKTVSYEGKIHTNWNCVPNQGSQTICGVQLTKHQGALSVRILACDVALDKKTWIEPSGNSFHTFEKTINFDTADVKPALRGWIVCMGLDKNKHGNAVLALSTAYAIYPKERRQFESFDSVLELTHGVYRRYPKMYFFHGNQYTMTRKSSGGVLAPYPLTIKGNWDFPKHWQYIQAAVEWHDGKIYFFNKNEYIRYNITTDKMDSGYPMKISAGWSFPKEFMECVSKNGIDAANGDYFFCKDEWILYKNANYWTNPQKLTKWGLPKTFESGITAMAKGYDDQTYVFKSKTFAVPHDSNRKVQLIKDVWF